MNPILLWKRILLAGVFLLCAGNILQAQLVINEIFLGDDDKLVNCINPADGNAWIEIYNSSPCTAIDLTCYQLSSTNGAQNLGSFKFPTGTTIAPLSFLVLGGSNVTTVDIDLTDYCGTNQLCGSNQWSLGNPYGWLALYDETADVVDALFWTTNATETGLPFAGPPFDAPYSFPVCEPFACADPGIYPSASGMDVSQSEIVFLAEAPNSSQTIHRDVDGGDWQLSNTSTPGACNANCITIDTPLSVSIDNSTNTNCDGINGTALATITGGEAPFEIDWSDGQSSLQALNLIAGDYTVEITDANMCTASAEVTIEQGIPIDFDLVLSQPSCFGATDGSIEITNITGGGGNYSYTWSSFPSDTPFVDGLPAGSYQVSISDGETLSTNIYEELFDGTNAWTLNEISGNNGADNNFWQINADEDGLPPGTCQNASTTNDPSLHITNALGIFPGATYDAGGLCGLLSCPETNMRAYSETIITTGVTDMTLSFEFIANGEGTDDNCSVIYSIDDGINWLVLDPSLKSPACGGGSEWTLATYALPPETEGSFALRVGFNWTNDDDGAGSDPSVAINNLNITTNSGTSCPAVRIISLEYPEIMDLNLSSSASACGANNGSITAVASGGDENFTFTITPGGTQNNTGVFNNLAAGTYDVEVLDGQNCSAQTQTIQVGEVAALNCDDNDCTTEDSWNPVSCDCSNQPILPENCDDGLCENGLESYDASICECIPGVPPASPSLSSIAGAAEICGAESLNYSIQDIDASSTYTWVGPSNADFNINGNTLNVDWSTLTAGNNSAQICLEQMHDCFTLNDTCLNISVNSILPSPALTCTVATENSISFEWTEVNQATTYLLSYVINTGAAIEENTDMTSFTVDGLQAGDTVNLSVIASAMGGPCESNAPSVSTSCFIEETETPVEPSSDNFLEIPNAFSPNFDETNDEFRPLGNFDEFQLLVFNRYGQLIYDSNNSSAGWDGLINGDPAGIGVYLYIVTCSFSDGTTREKCGSLTLIR